MFGTTVSALTRIKGLNTGQTCNSNRAMQVRSRIRHHLLLHAVIAISLSVTKRTMKFALLAFIRLGIYKQWVQQLSKWALDILKVSFASSVISHV